MSYSEIHRMYDNEREAMIKGARSKGIYTTSVKRLMPIMEREGYTWGTCPKCGGTGDYHTLCDEHGQCGADCENPDPLSVPCISNLCLACKGHGKGWFKADMEVDNG